MTFVDIVRSFQLSPSITREIIDINFPQCHLDDTGHRYRQLTDFPINDWTKYIFHAQKKKSTREKKKRKLKRTVKIRIKWTMNIVWLHTRTSHRYRRGMYKKINYLYWSYTHEEEKDEMFIDWLLIGFISIKSWDQVRLRFSRLLLDQEHCVLEHLVEE